MHMVLHNLTHRDRDASRFFTHAYVSFTHKHPHGMSVAFGRVISVSIAELPNRTGRSETEFERTPPQDLIAEQSVLGGMLLSKDAIADVVEVLRERDFYRPAHEIIYDTILDLYGRGEPVDAVTVSA